MRTDKAVVLFLTSRKAKRLAPETIRWYSEILSVYSRRYHKLPKKPETIEEFLQACPAGDERRHGYYRAVRCLYRYLERRHNQRNPTNLIDAPKRRRKEPNTLTAYELYKLLSYPHAPRIKAALQFLADTGARLGELYNLRAEDIKETPWGYVAKINGKTGTRLVPLQNETYRAIVAQLPFPYKRHRLGMKISKAIKTAGVKGTAHTLRHTFATLWAGSEFALQRIMGHSNLETLRLYRHLKIDVLCEQHSKYTPVNAGYSSQLSEVMV